MTADTDRWLALCAEAEAEHGDINGIDPSNLLKREPKLTKAIRELVAENERQAAIIERVRNEVTEPGVAYRIPTFARGPLVIDPASFDD